MNVKTYLTTNYSNYDSKNEVNKFTSITICY